MHMQLDYLLFDFTDDEAGSCSFDAMASVLPARLPALIDEIEAVLGWAYREFGAPSAAADEGEWGFELQAMGEHEGPLEIAYDFERAGVSIPQGLGGRVTLALTLSGSHAFGSAFRNAFPDSG
jgi:hypothetical protein